MSRDDIETYRQELEMLRSEHRDLDDVIARLADDPSVDEYEIKRLKKRKLHLKDSIARLEGKLAPDISA